MELTVLIPDSFTLSEHPKSSLAIRQSSNSASPSPSYLRGKNPVRRLASGNFSPQQQFRNYGAAFESQSPPKRRTHNRDESIIICPTNNIDNKAMIKSNVGEFNHLKGKQLERIHNNLEMLCDSIYNKENSFKSNIIKPAVPGLEQIKSSQNQGVVNFF